MASTVTPPPSSPSMSYPAALDELHHRASPGGLVRAPSGYVLASPAALPAAEPGSLGRFGLAVDRQLMPADDDAQDGETAAGVFADGLLDLHRSLLYRVVQQAMQHLEARTSAGSTLLSMQLVQGQLADIAMRLKLEAAVSAVGRAAGPQARWRSHQRLVAAGRGLVRLFGASGFLADGPAGELYLAEVAGNVYLCPEGSCADD